MSSCEGTMEQLLQKANTLPMTPGVYLMRDKHQKVIYVGKSRKLKNRVSQYFQNNQKNLKTAKMVRLVADFDYILCQTEMEALTLENTLIKQYLPKYNIRLKDAKSYPYIKITSGEFPRIVYTRSRLSDKAKYFGPFSGTATVFSVLDILHKSLGIPSCKRSFPKDIGKERPCIYYQMKQCCGVCTGRVSEEEYQGLIRCATDILRGHTAGAMERLEKQMREFAEAELFESAAKCRDTMEALRRLNQKQHVVASPETNVDVFSLFVDGAFACVSAMYVRDGAVTDKADFLLETDVLTDSGALAAFLTEHYMRKEVIPKQIMVSFELEEDDRELLELFLSEHAGRKVSIKKPERGAFFALCNTVLENAEEKVRQSQREAQQEEGVLASLAELLALETLPERIEAYDISNIGNENITAGMVVFQNGMPKKSDYRVFHIKSVSHADDYASMRETLTRRLKHLSEDQNGSFSELPDLLLIDGGHGHVSVVREVLRNEGVEIPVFGMVKDEYHKTRALCTEDREINIAKEKAIFMLIYKIQEEVHRFTVGQTTNAKRKTMKHSSLEKIDGIGAVKAKKLMAAMGTLSAIKQASLEELSAISGITNTDAQRIYDYFHSKNL